MCSVRIGSAYSSSYNWLKLVLVPISHFMQSCWPELWSLLVSRMPRVLVHLLVTTSDVAVASLTVEHLLTRPLAIWRSLWLLQLFTAGTP